MYFIITALIGAVVAGYFANKYFAHEFLDNRYGQPTGNDIAMHMLMVSMSVACGAVLGPLAPFIAPVAIPAFIWWKLLQKRYITNAEK
jgi:hypothetical protein